MDERDQEPQGALPPGAPQLCEQQDVDQDQSPHEAKLPERYTMPSGRRRWVLAPARPFPRWAVVAIYLALPLLTFVSIHLTAASAWWLAGVLMCALYWLAFDRARTVLVVMALALCSFSSLLEGASPYAVLWVAAMATAGASGAWLTRRRAHESHLLFIPLLTAVACFIGILWLGQLGRVQTELEWVQSTANQFCQEYRAMLDQIVAAGQLSSDPEAIARLENIKQLMTPRWVISSYFSMLALGLWLAGRTARLAGRRLAGRRHALILFRLHEKYIFLLIAGLIFAILGSLPGRHGMLYVAYPVLAVLATACFFAGVGVVLFFGALRRAAGRPGSAVLIVLAGLMASLLFPSAAVLLGLADVWFDFRRLSQVGPGPRP